MGSFAKKLKKHFSSLKRQSFQSFEKIENEASFMDKSFISQGNPKQDESLGGMVDKISISEKLENEASSTDKSTISHGNPKQVESLDNMIDKISMSEKLENEASSTDKNSISQGNPKQAESLDSTVDKISTSEKLKNEALSTDRNSISQHNPKHVENHLDSMVDKTSTSVQLENEAYEASSTDKNYISQGNPKQAESVDSMVDKISTNEKLKNEALSTDKSSIFQHNPKHVENLDNMVDKTSTSVQPKNEAYEASSTDKNSIFQGNPKQVKSVDSMVDKISTSEKLKNEVLSTNKSSISQHNPKHIENLDSMVDKTSTSVQHENEASSIDKSSKQTQSLKKSTGDKISTSGKPIRCKAAVCRAPGERLVIEEIMVAPPMPHEVRIRIICSSLCHTDIDAWKLKNPTGIFPRIFGHEAVGVVESVGEDVHEVTEGDTVIPTFVSDCGECEDCRSKRSNLCSKLPFRLSQWMPRYETSRFTDLNGNVIYHFMFVSSFSEYTVVDVAHATKFDPSIPPNRACLLSCGVSTGVGAAWKTANVEAGSTVAIFGLGSIGLAVAEGARLCGATRIIGVDLNPDKYEIGKKFGVTEFVNPGNCGDKSVSQVINEMTNGGADYCFECIGSASLVHEAYACCRNCWGKTIIVGVARPGSELGLSFHDVLHAGGKSIMGSIFGGIKPKSDIPILLKRYLDKELQLDQFITHEIQFEDINKAFDLLIEGQSLRCVIWMDK